MKQINITSQDNIKHAFDISFLNEDRAKEIAAYHQAFPMYKETPLVRLSNLAKRLHVGDIFVKDESHRFGLNAFKVLGGSYAIGRIVADKLGMDLKDLPFERLISDEIRDKLGEMTFVTATDGNHGRGVAWTANQLKQKSIVFMPRGTAQERVENIEKENATVTVLDKNYDECVQIANALAEENGYVFVQDTAWVGYEEIPAWIMQGYMTMSYEIYQSLEEQKVQPTHIFLQAGVGSLAAAAVGFFANVYPGDKKPVFTIVEPDVVDCLFQSAKKQERVLIGGEYSTIMAGLACGEPNTTALNVLWDYAEHFLSAGDSFAAHGMRLLGHPMTGDEKVVSGESGAAPFGVITKVLAEENYADIKKELGLNEDSVLVFISTEGDTDRKNYEDIVWDGKYPSVED